MQHLLEIFFCYTVKQNKRHWRRNASMKDGREMDSYLTEDKKLKTKYLKNCNILEIEFESSIVRTIWAVAKKL